MPVLDKTLTAQTTQGNAVQARAEFGWTMAGGKLGLVNVDNADDLAIAAITHDMTGAADIGAGFVYVDGNLDALVNQPLLPTPSQRSVHLGQLGNAIGDVRGTATAPQTNLLFLGAFQLDTDFTPSCNQNAQDLGGVAIFDLTATNPTAPAMRIPPKDTSSQCYPAFTKHFGHSIAIADVDGDGTKDLLVGAHGSDGGEGRVYVFFGHAGFWNTVQAGWPYAGAWLAIQAPLGGVVQDGFGTTIVAEDLDGDGKAEAVICASQRTRAPGYVLVVRGSRIAQWRSQIVQGSNHLFTPQLSSSDFQKLEMPAGSSSGNVFGWTMTVGPFRGTDAALDLAVYAENPQADVPACEATHPCAKPCLPTPPAGQETGFRPSLAGALYLYKNVASGLTGKIFEDGPFDPSTNGDGYHVLTSPFFTPEATPRARFGRSAAVVKWADSDGSLRDRFLVGEPGAYTHGHCQAGRIYLYALPIEADSSGNLPAPLWMAESPNREACSHFGAQLVALQYDASEAAQQIAVSQREGSVGTEPEAGIVYTFRGQP